MDTTVAAALAATLGFAGGDVLTALLARRVSGRASMALLTVLKLALYVPFIVLLHREFAALDAYVLWWSLLLGVLFFAAYWGFTMGLATAKSPALVGVVAGCFPASAAVVAIVFLGQRPTAATIGLLLAVLVGVVLIGLPDNWRRAGAIDKGLLLALLPLVCWGIFGSLLHKPINHLGTAHGWFVVQVLVAVVMVLGVLILYGRQLSGIASDTAHKKAWLLAVSAGIVLGLAEMLQTLSLGDGARVVITEALLGSYPAAYFLIAHKIFKEPLHARQWVGIALVAVCIVLLSTGSSA